MSTCDIRVSAEVPDIASAHPGYIYRGRYSESVAR
jgi:hypothetical protein